MLIEWCCLLCGVVHLIDDEAESSIADLLPQVFARYFASRKVAPSQNGDYSTPTLPRTILATACRYRAIKSGSVRTDAERNHALHGGVTSSERTMHF